MNNDEFWNEVVKASLINPEWRYGQTCFNVLYKVNPEKADAIRGLDPDPFYIPDSELTQYNPDWLEFVAYIRKVFPEESS